MSIPTILTLIKGSLSPFRLHFQDEQAKPELLVGAQAATLIIAAGLEEEPLLLRRTADSNLSILAEGVLRATLVGADWDDIPIGLFVGQASVRFGAGAADWRPSAPFLVQVLAGAAPHTP